MLAALLTGVLAASAARADDDREHPVVTPVASPVVAPAVSPIATPDVQQPEQEQHWYGWQVLAADAAGIIGSVSCMSFADSAACLVPLLIAAPTVHMTHGRPMHGLASVGVRLGFPIAGAIVGSMFANCAGAAEYQCGLDKLALGLLVGTVVASAFDIAILSTETRERPAAPPSRLSFLSPSVSGGPSGASFGLRGTF